MKVQFPTSHNQRYYGIHYQYVLNLLKGGGAEVELKPLGEPRMDCGCFPMIVDGKEFIVDYTDRGFSEGAEALKAVTPFHCKTKDDRVFPFPPTSIHNWGEFFSVSQYKCEGDKVLFKQRSYGNAVQRRDAVRELLTKRYGASVDTFDSDPQAIFFKKATECTVSVHVPGNCNNMLDRAQFQLMGLGVCTISPELPEFLPRFTTLVPGEHYIRCADDYSDLIDKIEWCKQNRSACVEIGAKAKQLFNGVATPGAVVAYLSEIAR